MIFIDNEKFPVEKSMDGGDSAMRTGVLAVTGHPYSLGIAYVRYEPVSGWFVRHPTQPPWNNPNNFTRDQMICLVAGLWRLGFTQMIRRFFYARMRSFLFMQNYERDYNGSIKMLRPHAFYKDSKPTSKTYPMPFSWESFRFEIPYDKLIFDDPIEKKWFDWADPLLPNHIGFIILAGRIRIFYWFLIIAYPVHIIMVVINRWSDHEQNQIICECAVYRTLKFYKFIKKDYGRLLGEYWASRGETEYAVALVEMVERGI